MRYMIYLSRKKNVPWHILAPRRGCFGNHLPLRRVRILAERFCMIGRNFLSYRKSRMHFVLCMRQVSDYILFWLPDGLLLLQHFDRCLHLIIPLQRNIVLPDEILIQLLFHRYIRGQTFFMKIMSGRGIVVGGGDLDC